MPEYLDDPSVLTKDKLKSELLAHNVELPSGNPTKDVYVQLYLKNLTARNRQHVADTTVDAFSSDDELPPPVVSSRGRSSGRKATRKTDRIQPDELDVTLLTDQSLRDELLKHGVDVGPVVASTRKVYEKRLQKLLDDGPAPPPLPQLVLTEVQVNHNSNCESELYSDKEDEVATAAELEPVPVVERVESSRGKTPVTSLPPNKQQCMMVPEDLRPVLTDQVYNKPDNPTWAETCSTFSRPAQVEKIAAGDQTSKVDEIDVLKELLPKNLSSPTGLTATCRRPIKGAAGRPLKSSDLWNDENCLFSPKTVKTSSSSSSYTERISRVTSLPSATPSSSSTSSSTSSSSSVSSAAQTRAVSRSVSLWIKLFLLAIVAAFLFLVYQAMETNTSAPFPDSEVASGNTA
ncbi:hypothetical protein Q5P01_008421 [Channa striata]|uniref:Thymopoietin a n=1 Tax=Channa striata TaxID=64152 RepID=A0AA88MZJ1_CHASR|nr:hypothetical protein Q5P01_008421 [Channa striata]